MGETTAVDTAALAAAGAATARQSRDVLGANGVSGAVLARLSSEGAGSRTALEITATRQAVDGVLGDLAQVLDQLGRLLTAASVRYARAESAASSAAAAAGPGSAGGSVGGSAVAGPGIRGPR